MNPQGSSIINTQYFDKLTQQINSINTCAELQIVVNQAMATFQAQITALEQQLIDLLPAQALLTVPHDLASVITWITGMINMTVGPLYQTYLTYTAQLTALLGAIANLTAAMENAATRIEHCTIVIPPIDLTP